MKGKEIITLFAESDYLLDPHIHFFLCELPDECIQAILSQINIKFPDTLVITFQTLSKAMGMWVMIDHVTFRRAIFYKPDFNFYHGVGESVKSRGL